MSLEAKYVEDGYEGVMIRSLRGPYKCGRSTEREGYLLKLKRFHDTECRIVGFTERMKNTNEQTRDERGYAKRSSAKDGKVPSGTLGSLVCVLCHPADDPSHPDHHKTRPCTQFEVGTGFTDAERQMIWDERPAYMGSLTKVKYQELTNDGVPRFPVWVGFRSEDDL